MYPKNAATPPSVAVGSIYLIADGTLQTSGASVRVLTEGGAWGAGANALIYDVTSGCIYYAPSQGETNGEWFIVSVYKASCTSASITVITSAASVAGQTVIASTGADLVLKSSTFALAMADAVWDELLTGALHNVATSAGRRLRQANLGQAIADEGTAQAGGATTITLAATAEGVVDDLYHEALVFIAAGTGAGQVRFILSYAASTRIATVHAAWETNPSTDSEYIVYGNAAANLHAIQDDAQSATDLKDFVDAGYDPGTNKVQGVLLVDTTTTNTDLAAHDAKLLAYVQLLARSDTAIETDNATELTAINADGGSGGGNYSSQTDSGEAIIDYITANIATVANQDTMLTNINEILIDTGTSIPALIATAQADLDTITDTGVTCVALTTAAIADVWATDTLTESYAADGSAATPAQLLHMLWSALSQFDITTTVITSRKLDGTTQAMTFTLDDATTPTKRWRAS